MKNTKEAVVGFIAIAALLAHAFKDGVQAADAMGIWMKVQSNPELMMKLTAAYSEIDQIGSELSDISVEEVLEVVAAAIPEIRNLIAAVKDETGTGSLVFSSFY